MSSSDFIYVMPFDDIYRLYLKRVHSDPAMYLPVIECLIRRAAVTVVNCMDHGADIEWDVLCSSNLHTEIRHLIEDRICNELIGSGLGPMTVSVSGTTMIVRGTQC